MSRPEPPRFGWDVGGAHLKISALDGAAAPRPGQWPCPLWRGLAELDAAVDAACARWPALADPAAHHALTMSGEMVDAFPDRAAGVQAIVRQLRLRLPGRWQVYAGEGRPGARWLAGDDAAGLAARWADIASANWQATAAWLATPLPEAVLVDIGSTTADLVLIRHGRLVEAGASDAQRLRSGALVYQGVVRTPLCALGPDILLDGQPTGLMNEWFATSADVYRLLGRLDPAHDQQPTADGADKSLPATRQRLARLVGCDAADHPPAVWQALAAAFQARQLQRLQVPLAALIARHGLPPQAPLVAAGCGDFLGADLAAALGRPLWRLGAQGPRPAAPAAPDGGGALHAQAARVGPGAPHASDAADGPDAAEAADRWARVAAPSLAVAALARQDAAVRGGGPAAVVDPAAGAEGRCPPSSPPEAAPCGS